MSEVQPARSNSQLLLPWLSSKEKLIGSLVIMIAFAISVTALVLTSIFAVPKMSEPSPKGYYPDILKEKCSTCWEATIFATRSDPFYEWVTSSSLPEELNVSQRGTIAYQRASIWRVSGNTTKNETTIYNSPDPHIMGGDFVKRSRTLVWKMTVNWGTSVRLCLTVGSLDSCLNTVPIVRSPRKNSSVASYAALLIGVPYRKQAENINYTLDSSSFYLDKRANINYTLDSSSFYLDKRATYLTNFVSNARTGPGLTLNKHKNDYVYEGNTCRKSSPVFFTPDVVSYLGFPSLQCACSTSGRLCMIALEALDGVIHPLQHNSSGCYEGRSFWDIDVETYFFSYSSRWNKSISLQVNLSKGLSLDEDFLFELENFTSCAETFIDLSLSRAPNSTTFIAGLKRQCSTVNISVLPATFNDVFDRYMTLGALALEILMQTFNKKIPNYEDDDAYCGLDAGQTRLADNICMMSLEELKSNEAMEKLDKQLKAFSKVMDVKKYVTKQWEESASQRSDIVIGIVTAVVTILVTIWGMFNRDLQEVEALVLKWLKNFTRFVNETVGISMFKMGIRAVLLLGVIIWNMSNVFRSLNIVGTKPRFATSGTLLQRFDDISFLVTTTSTVQVIPEWIIFYASCSVMAFVFVVVVFGIYVRMRYIDTSGAA